MNGSVGQALRDARLAKKLTIEEAARATKIRPDRIADLEQDDYMRFPNIVYARNFLILYAKYLGVDISRYPTVEIGFDTGVSEYSYLQQDDGSGAAPAARKRRRRDAALPPEKPRWLIAFFIFLVAFAAAALIGWSVMTIKRLGPVGTVPPKEAASPATPTPAPVENPGNPASRAVVPEPVRRPEPVIAATEAPAQMPGADPVPSSSPEPTVKVAVPVPVAAPVAAASPSPAVAEPTPVVEGEEMEVTIRSNRKIRLRVVRDDPKSPSVYHGSLNPLMKKPLVFVGKHFWIKTADPDALNITINGKPAPASVVEVIPTPGI